MHAEDIKTWHWVIIGIIVGLLVGCVKLWQGPWFDTPNISTMSDPARFEMALLAKTPLDLATPVPMPAAPTPAPKAGRKATTKPARVAMQYPLGVVPKTSDRNTARYHKGQPLVKDLVVHPPIAGGPPRSYWVTGKMCEVDIRHQDENNPASALAPFEQWIPFNYEAKTPYVARFVAPGKYPTVAEFLAAAQRDPQASFTFRYSWWESTPATLCMPAVAGLLVIGIAWPMMIGLMQRGGLARLPQPKKAKLPKNRKLTADQKPVDHSAGDKQLDDLNAALEAQVAGYAATTTDPDDSSIPMPVPSVKSLSGADQTPGAASATPDEIVEYGGEFYPVVKAVHPKDAAPDPTKVPPDSTPKH